MPFPDAAENVDLSSATFARGAALAEGVAPADSSATTPTIAAVAIRRGGTME